MVSFLWTASVLRLLHSGHPGTSCVTFRGHYSHLLNPMSSFWLDYSLKIHLNSFLRRSLWKVLYMYSRSCLCTCWFYLHLVCHAFIGMGSSSGPFCWLQQCGLLGGAGWSFTWSRVPVSLASFFIWSFSFTHFVELSLLLRVFNLFNTHTYPLGKNLALVFNSVGLHCRLPALPQ